ncbi:MAG: exosortase/archaeosortase family protein [Thermoplasmata archaeon]
MRRSMAVPGITESKPQHTTTSSGTNSEMKEHFMRGKAPRRGPGSSGKGAPRRRTRFAQAAGLILAFVGVNLQWLTHLLWARWLGVGLILAGAGLAFYTALVSPAGGEKRTDLAHRLIKKLTLGGRLVPIFPILAAGILAIDLVWNFLIAKSTVFLSQDWTLWALAAVLFLYPLVPPSYGKERDFALILVALFTLTMVVPMGLYRLATGTIELPGGFVEALLGAPTAAIVGLTGVHARAHGIYVTFQMSDGRYESLGISTACAGLDSLFLFISGFVAFILVENPRMDARIAAALFLGILTAYLANLLRMTVIVLAGVHWGREAMLSVHENAGTLIFLGWIGIFWYLMYRFVLRAPARAPGAGPPAR